MNADDFETLTYQMDSVQGKNLFMVPAPNVVDSYDRVDSFVQSLEGAVVGAVVSGFSYVLTSGGEIDGVELAKS